MRLKFNPPFEGPPIEFSKPSTSNILNYESLQSLSFSNTQGIKGVFNEGLNMINEVISEKGITEGEFSLLIHGLTSLKEYISLSTEKKKYSDEQVSWLYTIAKDMFSNYNQALLMASTELSKEEYNNRYRVFQEVERSFKRSEQSPTRLNKVISIDAIFHAVHVGFSMDALFNKSEPFLDVSLGATVVESVQVILEELLMGGETS